QARSANSARSSPGSIRSRAPPAANPRLAAPPSRWVNPASSTSGTGVAGPPGAGPAGGGWAVVLAGSGSNGPATDGSDSRKAHRSAAVISSQPSGGQLSGPNPSP